MKTEKVLRIVFPKDKGRDGFILTIFPPSFFTEADCPIPIIDNVSVEPFSASSLFQSCDLKQQFVIANVIARDC